MIEITPEYLASQGLSETFPKRFWSKVQKTDSCWIWLGSLDHATYGWIAKGSRKSGIMKAHRASWILHIGPIPDEMFILHHCDNPTCVNPHHLWIGTKRDNFRDAVEKKRFAIGEQNNMAKLTEKHVLEIRNAYSEGGLTQQDIADVYGVTRGCIKAVVNRTNWKHI